MMNLESKRWWNWLDQPIEELKEVLEESSLTFQGQTLSWVVANVKNPLKFILNIGNSRILFFYKTILRSFLKSNICLAWNWISARDLEILSYYGKEMTKKEMVEGIARNFNWSWKITKTQGWIFFKSGRIDEDESSRYIYIKKKN